MKTALIAIAAAVLIAAGSALPAYWVGDSHGAARVQQAWDNDTKSRATAALEETNTSRTKEQGHANSLTRAVDDFHAAQAPAAADGAARIADAERLQRAAEGRAAQYLAMSKAGAAERDRLASHAARLDASLAEGRRVAEQLRADLVDRDQRIGLLADVIRADRTLFVDAPTAEPNEH
ncbi:hypothetical protein [Variovorax guangxiensis]|uniref:Uncharacterized protein n=1 Tax=Variovorax guangxiensis TaxID=1775474 RepID=A0A840G2J0_9BURK|nr:hypothetical protein [Variovorax guangxiensis]MBB4225517.1 hypothetical protein [Variovorax guangxiensis]